MRREIASDPARTSHRLSHATRQLAMRFLITGVSGFVGTTLARHLLADGHEVFGTTRPAETVRRTRSPLDADHVFRCAG